MALITLTNDFHGTSTRTHSGRVSEPTARRIRNALCGSADCCCATSSLGTRGEQDATIEEMGDGSFHVASIASDTSTQIETPAEVLARLLGEDWAASHPFSSWREQKITVDQFFAACTALGAAIESIENTQPGSADTMTHEQAAENAHLAARRWDRD
mgnify:CR=1 FL=1